MNQQLLAANGHYCLQDIGFATETDFGFQKGWYAVLLWYHRVLHIVF